MVRSEKNGKRQQEIVRSKRKWQELARSGKKWQKKRKK